MNQVYIAERLSKSKEAFSDKREFSWLNTTLVMRYLVLILAFAVAVVNFADPTDANLSFASYYESHMVLQQSPERATVWGTGAVGSVLTFTLTGSKVKKVFKTRVDEGLYPDVNTKAGVWKIVIDAMAAGGLYTITVNDDASNVIKISDVMFGDVWICSGQSNMQFIMKNVMHATAELATADNYPDIRMMKVDLKTDVTPRTDIISKSIPWTISSSDSTRYFSAVCWMYARYLYKRLNYPIGLVQSSWGATAVEKWSSPDALKKCNVTQKASYSLQWNAMIHPLLTMTIKGAIWYQGEANSKKPIVDYYACSFPAMIDDWRSKFNRGSEGETSATFPFGFVQLAGWLPPPGGDSSEGFPDVRWHQTADYGVVPNPRMSNVFMAVAMDLPDFDSPNGNIHPRHKRDISDRLGLAALGVAYGQDVDYKHLMPSLFIVNRDASRMRIEFDQGTRPLEIRDKNGLEICCSADKNTFCGEGTATWSPVIIKASTNTSATIDFTNICDTKSSWIVGVRYAWKISPCTFKNCALYGATNQLPVPPFVFKGVFSDPGKRFKKVTVNDMKSGSH